jgi:hypothetical protein
VCLKPPDHKELSVPYFDLQENKQFDCERNDGKTEQQKEDEKGKLHHVLALIAHGILAYDAGRLEQVAGDGADNDYSEG